MATRWVTSLGLGLAIVDAATTTATPLTGCQQCEQTQRCDLAFRNTPGIFCGHWLSGSQTLGCCCPTGAKCVVTNYACNCDTNTITTSNSSGAWPEESLAKTCQALCCCTTSGHPKINTTTATFVQTQPYPMAVPVQQPAYPMQKPGYPVQQGSYPIQQPGYPVQQGSYPMQQPGYPMQQPAVVYAPQPQVVVHHQPGVVYGNNSGFVT
ncbi:hypothetical protein AaE_014740, partial [Aphanomyces astaci]